MDTQKLYPVFFDLDRTILSLNSGSVLVREAHKSGLMSSMDFLNAIWLSLLYKFHLRDTSVIITGMGKWLKGKKSEDVSQLSRNIVETYLVKSFRPEMLAEIAYHKDNKAEIVILSSAIIELCRPLNEYLGADHFICSSMEVRDGIYTGQPIGGFCFEEEKRVRLLEYCKANSFNPAQAFYYGDSIADLPALEAVGNPACVSPDKKLLKIANDRGWKVFDI